MEELDKLMTMDNLERVLRREFADCDEHIKKLIEELIDYTKEYENDDLKKFVADLCLLKKMGYLDIVYDDKVVLGKSSCYFNPLTSIITLGKDDEIDDSVSLFAFIHEVTHAFHEIAFFSDVPEEFKQVKEKFQKYELVHVYVAGYIHSITKDMYNLVKNDFFEGNESLLKKAIDNIHMHSSFEDIYDALLNGRLHDGVNITSLAYNEFYKLGRNSKKIKENLQSIIEEFDRVYRNKQLYNFSYSYESDDIIRANGHGSNYFRDDDKTCFKEVIAQYMSIKLASGRVGKDKKEFIDECLKAIFGDMLEKYSKNLVDGIFSFANLQVKQMLNDDQIDGDEFLRELDSDKSQMSPLSLAFVSDEKKRDKEFMIEFLDKAYKFHLDKKMISRLISKELCSDLDFLKQVANLSYDSVILANRGTISKDEYTELATLVASKSLPGFDKIMIDKLENGMEDYESMALKYVEQGSNFKDINRNDLISHDGGIELYKKIALKASVNNCPVHCFNPNFFKGLNDENFYFHLAVNCIKNNPFDIDDCVFSEFDENQRAFIFLVARNSLWENVEDVHDLSQEQLRTVGMFYGILREFVLKPKQYYTDEELEIIRDRLDKDIRDYREKKNKDREAGKSL